ncbi:MAG: YlxR family protein [Clostridia bacterium]|nr:YlxR family protein [Clostridia bacterium]
MAEKKIPMRTCIACRSEKPKKELIRIVKNKENVFAVDRTGKLSGRGAYICDDKACMQKLLKKRLLNHAFEMEVSEEVYKAIEEEFFGKI